MSFSILSINPGSTSTKIAEFRDETLVWQENIQHAGNDLASYSCVLEQFCFRLQTVEDALFLHDGENARFDAVVGRGGLIDPVPGGTFQVDLPLIERLRLGKPWDHASNLGGILAEALASKWGVPAYIVDPVRACLCLRSGDHRPTLCQSSRDYLR